MLLERSASNREAASISPPAEELLSTLTTKMDLANSEDFATEERGVSMPTRMKEITWQTATFSRMQI